MNRRRKSAVVAPRQKKETSLWTARPQMSRSATVSAWSGANLLQESRLPSPRNSSHPSRPPLYDIACSFSLVRKVSTPLSLRCTDTHVGMDGA